MCSIIVIKNHYKVFPLVIASNRDEHIGRPSSGVQLLSTNPLIMGARDDLKGGTWLAVNNNSLFVAITNQGNTNESLETRGKIVMEALKSSTIDDLINFVEEINPSLYNKFNLIFGNQDKVYVAHSYLLHSMVIKELNDGINIISDNMVFNTISKKNSFIHSKLDRATDQSWIDYYGVIKKILSNKTYGILVNNKINNSCTRSSTILAFSKEGLARYKFYDRSAQRPERKPNDPIIPKYKDYIDIFRQNAIEKQVSEEVDNDDEEDEAPASPIPLAVQFVPQPSFSTITLNLPSDYTFNPFNAYNRR